MCGRFVLASTADEIVAEFAVAHIVTAGIRPSWNVAPGSPIAMVTESIESGVGIGTASATGADAASPFGAVDGAPRTVSTARWGLVPHWAKDASIGSKMINARSETVTEKPAFRAAVARRRCLVPANGYYEWMPGSAPGGGAARRTPYYLHPAGGGILAMAGLYETWRDPELPEGDPHAVVVTCTVITRAAPDALGHIHDRSPVIVPTDLRADWLDCGAADAPSTARRRRSEAAELLAAMPLPELVPRRVGPAVGSVRNNGPHLVEPVDDGIGYDGPRPRRTQPVAGTTGVLF